MYFISRVLSPVLTLNTTREAETFLDADKEFPDWTEFFKWGKEYIEIGRGLLPRKLVRVLAVVEDETKFKEEIESLVRTAQDLAEREDLRIAVLRNRATIDKLRTKHPDWFASATSTSFLLLSRSGNSHLDTLNLPLDAGSSFFIWITEYFR